MPETSSAIAPARFAGTATPTHRDRAAEGDALLWRLQLCGRPELVAPDGERVALERRDAALLALLAIDGPTARSRVIALLWPDQPPEQVRGRLRQRIYALKRRLGTEAVVGDGTLGLAPRLHWPGFDGEPLGAPVLGDDAHADLPDFAPWLQAVRERAQRLHREQLAGEASALEHQGRLAEAIVAAEQLLALEPLQEHAHRRLMRLHYLRGDRAAALRAFDHCEQQLKHELSARPSAETLELLAQIEQAQLPAPAVRRTVPASVQRPPRLIGRDGEWAQLQAAWARGEAVVLIGEAGMGKTRLLGDLVLADAAAPGRVIQVCARPGDERVPHALLSRLLRGMTAARREPLPPGVEREFARLLPELPQPASADRQTAATATQTATHTAAAQARFVGAIETALQQAIAAGLEAVVLDDLHFADPASLEIAQHLAGMPGLRWLAAFRGAEIGAEAQRLVDTLTGIHHAAPIVLQPLTPQQVAELIASLGIDGLDAPALAGALHQRTGGNPLFLLETLKILLQQGDPAAGTAAALAGLPASGSIGRLIARRLAGISPPARKLLQCAAVAGQDFSVELASRLLGVRAIDLAAPWDELESNQLMRDGAFAHDLIHDAALASVPEAIARQLHADVAEWMQAGAGEPARVALHWQHAGRPALAGPAWLAAAERCGARGRRAEQAQLLERAASAFEQANEAKGRSHALLLRAEVVGGHAEFDAGKQALEAAAAAVVDDEDRLRLAVANISVRTFHGEEDHTLAHAPAALARAIELGRHGEAMKVLLPYCVVLSRSARANEAVQLLADQRPWVDAHGSPEQHRQYWDAMALALDYGSRMRESMQAWECARLWAERSGSDMRCQVIGNMAYTSAKMGDVRRAAALGEQALNLALADSDDGFDHQVLEQKLALGHHLRNLGRYGEALQLLESAAAGYRHGGADLKVNVNNFFLAVLWVQLGQHARALQLTAADVGAPLPHIRALRLAFQAMAMRAAGQDARESLHAALAFPGDAEVVWRRVVCLVATAILPPDEAEPMAKDLAAWSEARERFGLALAAHGRAAHCALACGAPARALPHLQAALQFAQGYQPDVYYLPELWWTAAQVYAALGDAEARWRAVDEGARWVRDVAAQHVPEAFQHSFLNRNPVNADLLRWARTSALAG